MIENSLKKYFLIGTPYLIISSTLYLFGFWSSFNINILEHIAAADIVKLSAYPLSYYTICFVFGASISEISSFGRKEPGGGANTAIGRFGRRNWKALLILDIIAIFIISVVPETPYRFLFASVLLAIPISTALTHLDPLINLLPNPSFRGVVLFLFIVMPMLSFSWGHIDSAYLISGNSKYIVDSKLSEEKWPSESSLSYIGLYGGSYFLYSHENKKLIITSKNSLSSISIIPNDKKKK